MSNYKLDIDISPTLSPNLLHEWKTLWNSSTKAHFFNSPLWVITCDSVFNYKKKAFLRFYEDSKLVGIIPLVASNQIGSIIYILPGKGYYDLAPVLFADGNSSRDGFCIAETKRLGTCYIDELPSSILSHSLFNEDTRWIYRTSISPYLPMAPDPLRFFSKTKINNLSNRMKSYGGRFSLYSNTGKISSFLPIVYEIEKHSYKKKNNNDMFSIPVNRIFYETLASQYKNSIITHLLYHNDKPVAYDISFKYENTVIGVNKAFLSEYSHISPGKILPLYYLKTLFNDGIQHFILSRGDDSLKKEFTPYASNQYGIFITRSRVKKITFIASKSGLNWLRKNNRLYELLRKIKKRMMSSWRMV